MAKKDSSNILLIGLVVVVVVILFMSRSGTTVLVQDSPIKFDSVRKHPLMYLAIPILLLNVKILTYLVVIIITSRLVY